MNLPYFKEARKKNYTQDYEISIKMNGESSN